MSTSSTTVNPLPSQQPVVPPQSSPESPLPHLFHHSNTPLEPLTQGAEAHLYLTQFLHPPQPAILKYRPPKPYRHPTLDKRLSRQRIHAEARVLVKARREGVKVPGVWALDGEGWIGEREGALGNDDKTITKDGAAGGEGEGRGGWMMLEFIDGSTVKAALQARRKRLNDMDDGVARGASEEGEELKGLMQKIGGAVARLHEVGIVHGDLTTSNMIIRPAVATASSISSGPAHSTTTVDDATVTVSENQTKGTVQGLRELGLEGDIYLIDFGLATQSITDEDKAVDLYVLERAFSSTHPDLDPEDGIGGQGGGDGVQGKEVQGRRVGFQDVLDAYGEAGKKGARVVLKRLEDVRLRGRKRSMLG